MTIEHPVEQQIKSIELYLDGGTDMTSFHIGTHVTRIEACTKPGMHADIPYVRVWAGKVCLAEFCQHNIFGVYFADAALIKEF